MASLKWGAALALVLTLSPQTQAQEPRVIDAFGPFRIGMGRDGAMRAAPANWIPSQSAGGTVRHLSSTGPAISIATLPFEAGLTFVDNGLQSMRFTHWSGNIDAAVCLRGLQVVLIHVEAELGPFDGPAGAREVGVLAEERRTAGGSTLRIYSFGATETMVAAATLRGTHDVTLRAFYGSPRHRVQRRGLNREGPICEVELAISRPTAGLPEPPPQPTAEELASAELLSPAPWTEQPNRDLFEANYPYVAWQLGVSGRASLSCLVVEGQRVRCAVRSATPEEHGFGAAALRLSTHLRVDLEAGGQPTLGRRVNVTFQFDP